MRIIVINLPNARERREAVALRFGRIDLRYELLSAVNGTTLSEEFLRTIDHGARDRMGLHRIDSATLGCTISHMAALRALAESDDDMAAIFEDDAQPHPDLPRVLDALQTAQANTKPYLFDVVLLQGPGRKRWFPIYDLSPNCSVGRVKYHVSGAQGYVISRSAAAHLIERFPHPIHEIDWMIPRFWQNGLRYVFVTSRAIVSHDLTLPSQISRLRRSAKREFRRRRLANAMLTYRRVCHYITAGVRRWIMFRALLEQDRNSRLQGTRSCAPLHLKGTGP